MQSRFDDATVATMCEELRKQDDEVTPSRGLRTIDTRCLPGARLPRAALPTISRPAMKALQSALSSDETNIFIAESIRNDPLWAMWIGRGSASAQARHSSSGNGGRGDESFWLHWAFPLHMVLTALLLGKGSEPQNARSVLQTPRSTKNHPLGPPAVSTTAPTSPTSITTSTCAMFPYRTDETSTLASSSRQETSASSFANSPPMDYLSCGFGDGLVDSCRQDVGLCAFLARTLVLPPRLIGQPVSVKYVERVEADAAKDSRGVKSSGNSWSPKQMAEATKRAFVSVGSSVRRMVSPGGSPEQREGESPVAGDGVDSRTSPDRRPPGTSAPLDPSQSSKWKLVLEKRLLLFEHESTAEDVTLTTFLADHCKRRRAEQFVHVQAVLLPTEAHLTESRMTFSDADTHLVHATLGFLSWSAKKAIDSVSPGSVKVLLIGAALGEQRDAFVAVLGRILNSRLWSASMFKAIFDAVVQAAAMAPTSYFLKAMAYQRATSITFSTGDVIDFNQCGPVESTGRRSLPHLACMEGRLANLKVLRVLIDDDTVWGAPCPLDGYSLLHTACAFGHLNCVRYLVEEVGVAANIEDRDGVTPYDLAQFSLSYYDPACSRLSAVSTFSSCSDSPSDSLSETPSMSPSPQAVRVAGTTSIACMPPRFSAYSGGSSWLARHMDIIFSTRLIGTSAAPGWVEVLDYFEAQGIGGETSRTPN